MPIPPYYPAGGIYLSNTPCTADFNAASISVGGYTSLSWEFVWTNFNNAAAVFTLQASNDNVNFVTKTGATFSVGATGGGSQIISLNQVVTEGFYRVVFTANGNTTGAVTVTMIGKN